MECLPRAHIKPQTAARGGKDKLQKADNTREPGRDRPSASIPAPPHASMGAVVTCRRGGGALPVHCVLQVSVVAPRVLSTQSAARFADRITRRAAPPDRSVCN